MRSSSSHALLRSRAAARGRAAPAERQQLAAGLDVVETGLLQRDADAACGRRRRCADVEAQPTLARAGGRAEQRREHADGRGLAGAVLAEEAEDLALRMARSMPSTARIRGRSASRGLRRGWRASGPFASGSCQCSSARTPPLDRYENAVLTASVRSRRPVLTEYAVCGSSQAQVQIRGSPCLSALRRGWPILR